MIFKVTDNLKIQTQHITSVEVYEENSIPYPSRPPYGIGHPAEEERAKYAKEEEAWTLENKLYTRYRITLVCGRRIEADIDPLEEEEL